MCLTINCGSCAQALLSELYFTLGKGNNGDEVEDKGGDLWPVKHVREDSQRNKYEEEIDLCGKKDGLEALEERQVLFVDLWASSQDDAVIVGKSSVKRAHAPDGYSPSRYV